MSLRQNAILSSFYCTLQQDMAAIILPTLNLFGNVEMCTAILFLPSQDKAGRRQGSCAEQWGRLNIFCTSLTSLISTILGHTNQFYNIRPDRGTCRPSSDSNSLHKLKSNLQWSNTNCCRPAKTCLHLIYWMPCLHTLPWNELWNHAECRKCRQGCCPLTTLSPCLPIYVSQ